ncbi:MAG: hypothetical protein H6741_06600 [Alphaproteobacteria bacterium]|nr:hypothetical protein [Alphaproteobacteria bacterium]
MPRGLPGWRLCVAIAAGGCGSAMDHQINPIDDEPRDVPDLRMSVDAALQVHSWGAQVGRCQLQIAFYEDNEQDGMGMGQQGEVIQLADDEGGAQCSLTVFEDQPAAGNWMVRGSRIAGDHLMLIAHDLSVPLELAVDGQGMQYYGLADCDAVSYPFGRLFTLDAPDTEADGVVEQGFLGSFQVADAVVTGAALTLLAPEVDTSLGPELIHDPQDDLTLAWALDADGPTLDGEPLTPRVSVTLRNMRRSDNRTLEALNCTTEGDSLTLPGGHLSLLTPSGGPEELYVALQVDAITEGPEVQLPWGQSTRSRSTMSVGGTVLLIPAE